MKIVKLALAAAVAFAPAMIFAQTTVPVTSTATHEKHATINQRKENQQDRIAQGVKAGTLSPAETARLERSQAKINHQTRDMREDNGGKLTAADREKLRAEQNAQSKRIYNTKHDRNGHK